MATHGGRYSPGWHYDHKPETRAALNLTFSDHVGCNEQRAFLPPPKTLLTHGGHDMHLADLTAYPEADRRPLKLYASPGDWAGKVLLSALASKFASDRPIAGHASSIRGAQPCPAL